MSDLFSQHKPLLALAPMQEVTDVSFWRVLNQYGGADVYFTEYFRVHRDSRFKKPVHDLLKKNPTGKPVIVQLVGEHIPSLVRVAKEIQTLPLWGIDFNLGCPAPIVCRKDAGGGLLKNPSKIRDILTALRESISVKFTVKTRVGYDSFDEFPGLLEIFAQAGLDALTVHARTVKMMYQGRVNYDLIRLAAQTVSCPVIANGDIVSPSMAFDIIQNTRAHGLMLGRGAIRNPWLFDQIRAVFACKEATPPALRQVREYIDALYEQTDTSGSRSGKSRVARMKKYMNFIAQHLTPDESFLQQIRRISTEREFFALCDDYLNRDGFFPIDIVPLSNAGNPRTDVLR